MTEMWTVIVKNLSSDYTIEDLGITVDATSSISFHTQFSYDEITNSDDLRDAVQNGDLVINDGSNDLSTADGVYYLSLENLKHLKENHYNKTELQTSGQSAVHWDNVTNAPSFGSVSWLEPVRARILGFYSTAPSGVEGDFYVDTDDDSLYRYTSSSWVDQGVSAGDRVIALDSTSENIYEYTGSAWDIQTLPSDNDAVIVDDDGDFQPAMYVYDTSIGSFGGWIKIADADILTKGNTLDQAYDQGGAGAGRIVTADTGAVKLDASSGTNAPIELTELSSLPTTGLGAGQVAIKGGILYVYDSARSKWLSTQRTTLVFGRKGSSKNQFLNFGAGTLPSNNSGYRIARNATIVSITGQLDGAGNCDIRLRKNDAAANIASLNISAAIGNQDTTININLNAGEYLQSYLDAAASVEDPMVVVELAWRE